MDAPKKYTLSVVTVVHQPVGNGARKVEVGSNRSLVHLDRLVDVARYLRSRGLVMPSRLPRVISVCTVLRAPTFAAGEYSVKTVAVADYTTLTTREWRAVLSTLAAPWTPSGE